MTKFIETSCTDSRTACTELLENFLEYCFEVSTSAEISLAAVHKFIHDCALQSGNNRNGFNVLSEAKSGHAFVYGRAEQATLQEMAMNSNEFDSLVFEGAISRVYQFWEDVTRKQLSHILNEKSINKIEINSDLIGELRHMRHILQHMQFRTYQSYKYVGKFIVYNFANSTDQFRVDEDLFRMLMYSLSLEIISLESKFGSGSGISKSYPRYYEHKSLKSLFESRQAIQLLREALWHKNYFNAQNPKLVELENQVINIYEARKNPSRAI